MLAAQNYKNHGRFHVPFHFVLMPILLINFISSIVFAVKNWGSWSYHGLWGVVMAFALILLAGLARAYALKVQNRVIRLEEKQRLAAVVTPSELVELARRAVREKLTNKQIKQAVVSWRGDYDRV